MEKEKFDTLFKNKFVTIKRITTPKNFSSKVFQQNVDEWVTILQGRVLMKVGKKKFSLKTGSHLFLPRKVSHQFQTSKTSETIWLCVYFGG